MSGQKMISYIHRDKEVKRVMDMDGRVEIPGKDGVVVLDGKRYRVLTGPQWDTGQAGQLPVYKVYLEEG